MILLQRPPTTTKEQHTMTTDTDFITAASDALDNTAASENRWGGVDFFLSSGATVRVNPVDRAFAYGAEVYVLGPPPARLCQREARVSGVTPEALAAVVVAMTR